MEGQRTSAGNVLAGLSIGCRRGTVPGVRIVNWNLNWRTGATATAQGEYLGRLGPDVALLQGVNVRALPDVAAAAGARWYRCSLDLREPMPSDDRKRERCCAAIGWGPAPESARLVTELPVAERALVTRVAPTSASPPVACVSYHAPAGVTFGGRVKARQAALLADWLAGQSGPVVVGAQANTPEVDHPDFARTQVHVRSGYEDLDEGRGEDVMFGPEKSHELTDAFRRWLADNPEEHERIRRERPEGPLAVSHYTGFGRGTNPRRYDTIWVSDHFAVTHVAYHYEEACAVGSDHAAVVVDLTGPA